MSVSAYVRTLLVRALLATIIMVRVCMRVGMHIGLHDYAGVPVDVLES